MLECITTFFKSRTQQMTDETILPAAAGFVLIGFTMSDAKPTAEGVAAGLRTQPIVGWRVTPTKCEPICFAPQFPNADVLAVFCPSNHIIEVNGDRDWIGLEAMKAALLEAWKRARPAPEMVHVIPGKKAMPMTYA
jgi:hypothetical protein